MIENNHFKLLWQFFAPAGKQDRPRSLSLVCSLHPQASKDGTRKAFPDRKIKSFLVSWGMGQSHTIYESKPIFNSIVKADFHVLDTECLQSCKDLLNILDSYLV